MMEKNRLQWACRRGMLELDLILNAFLDKHYPALSIPDQRKFKQLLACTDAELADWLLAGKMPPADFQALIPIMLKKHANSFI